MQQVVHQATHTLARFFLEIDANYKQFKTATRLRAAAAQRLDAQRAYYEEGRITIDRFLDAVSQYATAVATEAQYKTTYNIAIVALEEAKGTLLAYDNVVVGDPNQRPRYVQQASPKPDSETRTASALFAAGPVQDHQPDFRAPAGKPIAPHDLGSSDPARHAERRGQQDRAQDLDILDLNWRCPTGRDQGYDFRRGPCSGRRAREVRNSESKSTARTSFSYPGGVWVNSQGRRRLPRMATHRLSTSAPAGRDILFPRSFFQGRQ